MIGEGVIALFWCAIALSYFGGVEGAYKAGMNNNPANLVYEASTGLLGAIGGIVAILGVIILPITSVDTAFRAARLILSEFFKIPQITLSKRLILAAPLCVIGGILTQVNFDIVWRYFGVANQATAVFMLWTASTYLLRHNKFHWISTIPVIFMITVVITFLMNSQTLGFGLPMTISTILAIVITLMITVLLIMKVKGKTIEVVEIKELGYES